MLLNSLAVSPFAPHSWGGFLDRNIVHSFLTLTKLFHVFVIKKQSLDSVLDEFVERAEEAFVGTPRKFELFFIINELDVKFF